MMNRFLFVLVGASIIIGCSKDDDFLSPQEQFDIDVVKIDDYLESNGISAQTHTSGLRYTIETEGTGAQPTVNNIVRVNYKGTLLEGGATFDENDDFEFALSRVIQGWQIGIPLLKVGGSGTLYIPSGYAYGRSGQGSIPANAVLIFEVDLLEVK